MSLPTFSRNEDPGPSFSELLRRTGFGPPRPDADVTPLGITHGTTIVATSTPRAS
jgi:hypothetical protein